MITGHSDIAALKKVFFDYGALDYLIKPFDMTEVKLTVQRALHNRAMALRKTSVEEELKNRILQLERDFKEKTFRLRESQIKYKNIVNNSTDAILVVQNGSVKFINQRGIDLSGFSLSEILEKPLMSLIHPEDHSKALGNNQLHINGKKASFDNRFRIIKKNGTSFWAENQTVATTWLDRPATLHFVRDISHQKKLEEMMIRSEKMNSLGKLSAGLAHEIRNPLAVISSCAQFCMEKPRSELSGIRKFSSHSPKQPACQPAHQSVAGVCPSGYPSMETRRYQPGVRKNAADGKTGIEPKNPCAFSETI